MTAVLPGPVGSAELAERDPDPFLSMVITLRRLRSVPPDLFFEYWRDAHVQIACRLPGIHSLWINFLDYEAGQLWPRLQGIDHHLPEEDRFEGIPEPTFVSEEGLGAFGAAMSPLMDDEVNLFEEQIGYSSLGRNTRTLVDRLADPAPNGDEGVHRLFVFLKQSEDVTTEAFREHVRDRLAPALAESGEVLKLRYHLFEPYANDEVFLEGQDVSHYKDPDKQYQGAFEIVFGDALALRRFGVSETWLRTIADQRQHIRAQHSVRVTHRYCMRYNARITLAGLRTSAVADQIRRLGALNQLEPRVAELMGVNH